MRQQKSTLHLDSIVMPAPLSDEATHKARLNVARHSLGVEDCSLLLDMLGLNFDIDNKQ